MAGFMKGAMGGLRNATKSGLNKVETNFLGAADNHLYLGTHGQREGLIGGKNQVFDAHQRSRNANKAFKEEQKAINAMKAPEGADEAMWKMQQEASIMNAKYDRDQIRQASGAQMVGGLADMGESALGYVTGADRAGMGWSRAAAVGTRVGVPMAAAGALGVGARYASGGTMTQNRRGERDIAGVPFL